jgi:Ras-related protein Rab-6A
MSEDIENSYQIKRQKIILIGDVAVGKTSIINSLLGQKFNEEYEPSIGVDFFSKTLKYKGIPIKLQIWDSAGQEKFKSLIPNYIRGASLIFLVYDISNKKSFNNLNNWIEFINLYESTSIAIIGNKLDLESENKREISYEEGKKFSEEKKMDFFEVSAKTEKNLLKMLFLSIAALPFFTTLNNSKESKEKIAYDLEIENNENLNSLDRKEEIFTDIKDNNSLGLNDGDLQKNINVKLVKQVDNNNNTINQKNEKNKGKNGKKKKKCC